MLSAVQASPSLDHFTLFGSAHLLVLFTTLALPFALSRWTRRGERPRFARGLAVVLLLNYLFILTWSIHVGRLTRWPWALPMQLCDWASIMVIVALVWRRQQAYELAYFWGLSGTMQAMLTPDVSSPITDPLVVSFFIGHAGIVSGVLFLIWGLDFRPQPGAVLRAWLWSQLYFATAGMVNWLFAVNFGYLAAKPPHGSLLDWFGPWPWYLLTLEGIGALFFFVLYLPFWLARRMERRAQ